MVANQFYLEKTLKIVQCHPTWRQPASEEHEQNILIDHMHAHKTGTENYSLLIQNFAMFVVIW